VILARVFLPFALGYYLSYLLRVVNAVIAPDLIRELDLTASDLGLLTSANFFAFAAFQLPLGILLDRFGPRRTEAALLLVAASGALIFSLAQSLDTLILGRALIGLGTSACLMAAFKAYVMWFAADRIPLVNGFQMAAGGLGALTGTVPVESALAFTDWRGVFLVFAGLSLAAALVLFFIVPKRGLGAGAGETFGDQIRGIREAFTAVRFWRIAPLCVASQATFLGIQSLWAGPWLTDIAGLPRSAVAEHLLLVAAAMIAGNLTGGTIAVQLGRYGIKTMTVAVTGMTLFAVVQIALVLQWADWALVAWMLFGFFGTAGILPYAALPQEFRPELAGRVVTGINVLSFFGAFAAQWGIGAVIDLWPRTETDGYAVEGFQGGFAMMLGFQIAGLIWYAVSNRRKET